jgi:hypothetical protein
MYINKVGKSESADLYFDIMSKFAKNRESLEKQASEQEHDELIVKEAQMLRRLMRMTHVPASTSTAAKGVSRAIDSALNDFGGKQVQKFYVNGIGRLLEPAADLRTSMVKITGHMGDALDEMLKGGKANISKYMDDSGNFTNEGIQMIKTAARKGGAVSDDAADEIVDAILSGNIYKKSYGQSGGGPINRRLRQEAAAGATDAGAAGARAGDDAAEAGTSGARAGDDAAEAGTAGARAGDDAAEAGTAGARAEGEIPNPGKVSAEDLADAIKTGVREQLNEIQSILRKGYSRTAKGSADSLFANSVKNIDEALEVAGKIKNPVVRQKMQHSLQSIKSTMTELHSETAKFSQKMGDVFQIGDGNTIKQIINYGKPFPKAMDDLLESQIRSIGKLKADITNLQKLTVELGGDGAKIGDDVIDATKDAINASLDLRLTKVEELLVQVVKNGDEVADSLKVLVKQAKNGDAAAQKALDEIITIFKGLDGNLRVTSGKLFDELSKLGINIGPKAGVKANKFLKAIKWVLIGAGAWFGGKAAWDKWGPGSGSGSGGSGGGSGGGGSAQDDFNQTHPNGDHDGDGIKNKDDIDWGGPRPGAESGRQGYGTISNPQLLETLKKADPRSPSYDPQRGWENAQKTIQRLTRGGHHALREQYLRALTEAYDKSFKMKLDPPFIVPNRSTPIYYAFVNQHRSPAPNLAGNSGRTLAVKNMSFNDALNDYEDRTIQQIFDQTMDMGYDPQRSMNYTAEQTVAKGLDEKSKAIPFLNWFGKKTMRRGQDFLDNQSTDPDPEQGIAGHRRSRWSDADMAALKRRRYASGDRVDALMKLAEISKADNPDRLKELKDFNTIISGSTNISKNTDNQRFEKQADDFSKSYYKDAVSDLNDSDKTLRSYFAGLGGLYDERLEKRKADFKSLYNVTDESGEDLIYAAHPKEVVLSDAIGRGGLVENGLEQKRQTHGVALSAPTGNFRANYASRLDALKKLAN